MMLWLKEGCNLAETKKYREHSYLDIALENAIVGMPGIPDEAIAWVNLREIILRGFRTEGVYHYGDATLVVKTANRGSGIEFQEWQEVIGGAPNIAAMLKIYNLVREGRIPPDGDWEALPCYDDKENP